VARVLVIDERIVEIEQHRLRSHHAMQNYAASRLAFFRSCSFK
jgi:hypothetical protein